MIDVDNLSQAREKLAKSDGKFVPVPARLVALLLSTNEITTWRDPETGVDKIDHVTVWANADITIEGARSVCGYGPVDTVHVAVR